MLQDPNVERYVEQAMKPVLKQIKELKDEVELLKAALHKTDVHVAQLTFVYKSNETKCLLALSLNNARQETIYRETVHQFSIE